MSGSHIVAPGDTLSGIAETYQLSLDDLARWNDIDDPDALRVGQKIELSGHEAPDDEPSTHRFYLVRPRDTTSDLAEKFGLPWADIAAANGLDEEDALTTGQELLIPSLDVDREMF